VSYSSKSAFAALIFLSSAGAASAQELHPWYVAGGATGTFLKDPDSVIHNAPTPGATLFITNGLKDDGFGGQVAVGRAFGSFRLEAELGRADTHARTYNVRSPITASLPQTGGDKVSRIMANAYFDLPVERLRLHPYVGFGLGQADVHVTTKASKPFGPPTPPSQLIDDTLQGFAWQAMVGAAMPLNPRVALTVQYRWLDAGKLDGHDTRGQPISTKISGSNLDLCVRLAF
jgi:opacity protein-like surface antigen